MNTTGPEIGDAVLVGGRRAQISKVENGIVTVTFSNGESAIPAGFTYVDVDKARLVKLAEKQRESESSTSSRG